MRQLRPRTVIEMPEANEAFDPRLRPDLVPEHGARERFLMGTNVNTPFFKYPGQKSGTVPLPEYKVSTLYSGTELVKDISGTQCLNTALIKHKNNAIVTENCLCPLSQLLYPKFDHSIKRKYLQSRISLTLSLLLLSSLYMNSFSPGYHKTRSSELSNTSCTSR